MPSANDDERWRVAEERYRSILEEFGKFAAETQEYRKRNEIALAEVRDTMLTYWKATAAGFRQLSDWFADTEDTARDERQYERTRRKRFEIAIMVLISILIALVGGLLWVLR